MLIKGKYSLDNEVKLDKDSSKDFVTMGKGFFKSQFGIFRLISRFDIKNDKISFYKGYTIAEITSDSVINLCYKTYIHFLPVFSSKYSQTFLHG